MKKIVIALIILTVIVLSLRFPYVMLNPGELTEGHQEVKNECTSCHRPFWGIDNTKCTHCHKISEIGIKNVAGNLIPEEKKIPNFHSKLKNQNCTSCHTDHKGIHPQISLSAFDHDLLAGDVRTSCNRCHGSPADNLHKKLSASCGNCHNTNTWEFSGTFDHDKIVGMTKSNCSSCHEKPSDTFHQSTQDECEKCHSTNRWIPSTFDHSLYFLLDGDHNVKCSTCHSNNNFSIYTCYGCHEHSENKIREEHNEHSIYDFSDCASCHRSADEHDIKKSYERKKNGMSNGEIEKIKEYINGSDKKKKDHERDED